MLHADATRKKQLGNFLKIKRARLSPAQVGLPLTARRRTPGLRREEVAELIGVSVDWYTWLEQGRDIQVSSSVLERLAAVFQLTAGERHHIFLLARQQVPLAMSEQQEMISPTVLQFLEQQGSRPAYIMNIRWDVVAWNQSACAVFGDYSVLPLQDRNTIWRAFTSSYIKQLVDDWESHARKKAAQFRAGYARQCGDPWWDAMLERLSQCSEDFRRIWADHAVLDSPEGAKLLHHPLVGALYLEHLSFHLCDSPDLIMTVYLPKEQRTAEKLEHLL